MFPFLSVCCFLFSLSIDEEKGKYGRLGRHDRTTVTTQHSSRLLSYSCLFFSLFEGSLFKLPSTIFCFFLELVVFSR